MDSGKYKIFRDMISDFNIKNIEAIDATIADNEKDIFLIPKELKRIMDEKGHIDISKYGGLIELTLRNVDAFEQVLRIILSESNLSNYNAIYFISLLQEGMLSSIRKKLDNHDRQWRRLFVNNFLRLMNKAALINKEDSKQYYVIDETRKDLLEKVQENATLFNSTEQGNIFSIALSENEALKYIFDSSRPDEYNLQLRDIWLKAFACRDYLFRISISLMLEELNSSEDENDYYDDVTMILKNYFEIYYDIKDSSRIKEIFQFCMSHIAFKRRDRYSEWQFAVDHNIQEILIKCLLYKPDTYLNHLIFEYQKTSYQKAWEYGYEYEGTEISGGGLSISGSHFSMNDIPIVEKVLIPFLSKYYQDNYYKPNELVFIKNRILSDFNITAENPVYLKRATIPLLVKGFLHSDKGHRDEYIAWLEKISNLIKGIPSCREMVFSNIVNHLSEISLEHYEYLMRLINQDISNSLHGIPSNVFSVKMILFLIRNNYQGAKELMLNLIQNPYYIKNDRWEFYTFTNLGDINDYEPSFVIELMRALILDKDVAGNKTNWQQEVNINDIKPYLVDIYLSKSEDGEKSIIDLIRPIMAKIKKSDFDERLLNSFVSGISDKAPEKAYELTQAMLSGKKPYEVFTSYRDGIVDVADKLAKTAFSIKDNEKLQHNLLDKSVSIIELFMDDPDPSLEEPRGLEYHRNVENNIDEGIISTVRGRVCWAIQHLALAEHSFDKSWNFTKKFLADENFYVVKNAMVPFIEIMKRRTRWMSPDKINEVEETAIESLDKYGKYKPIIKMLLHVFSVFRSVNDETARKLIETIHDEEASFFYIYYSFFREDHFKDKEPFSGEWFRDKLKNVITKPSDNDLIKQLYRQFGALIEEDINHINIIFDYLTLYPGDIRHDERIINSLTRIVKQILDKDSNKNYLKQAVALYEYAIKIEYEYVKRILSDENMKDKHHYMDYYHEKILSKLYSISKEDFYRLTGKILEVDSLSEEKVYLNPENIVKIFKDESEPEFIEKGIKIVDGFTDRRPDLLEIKLLLESKLDV